MNHLTRTIIALLIVTFLFAGCSSSALTVPPSTPEPPPNPTVSPSSTPTPNIKVDVVYFHTAQRCVTCLCFEERINYVVNTYFSSELKGGKMTYLVLSIGDSKNKAIVTKYGAVGSQLFINTIVNGKENIKDIEDIWDWSCRSNKPLFDYKVKNVIERSLKGQV